LLFLVQLFISFLHCFFAKQIPIAIKTNSLHVHCENEKIPVYSYISPRNHFHLNLKLQHESARLYAQLLCDMLKDRLWWKTWFWIY